MDNKEVQIVVKCQQDLRKAFADSCKQKDTNSSREIRLFMRNYVKQHGQKKLEI